MDEKRITRRDVLNSADAIISTIAFGDVPADLMTDERRFLRYPEKVAPILPVSHNPCLRRDPLILKNSLRRMTPCSRACILLLFQPPST